MLVVLVVVAVLAACVVAGVVVARRVTERTRDTVERVRIRSEVAQATLMPSGPRRDAVLLRQRLAAQLRAATAVLGTPDGQVFRADAPTMLADITASARELDATLAGIAALTEDQQREALTAVTPQVEQLIATADSACRTMLETRSKTRSGQLEALSSDVAFEAASLATYERERNDLRL